MVNSMVFFTKKILYVAYFVCWFILAGASVLRSSAVWSGQCAFQTIGWLACTSDLSQGLRVFAIVCIFLLFGTFLLFARSAWQKFGLSLIEIPKHWLWAISFFALITIPLGTSDWPYYFSAGRALSEGLNPYVDNWIMYIDYASPAIKNPLSGFSYGPIIATIFRSLYFVAKGNALIFLLLWKCLMLVVLWFLGWLVFRLSRDLSSNAPKSGFIFWVIQPLLIFEWVVNGHFDGLWLLFVFCAIWAANRNQWWLSMPALIIGVWIKFIPVLLVPFFALWWWQTTTIQNWKKKVGQLLIGFALSLIITVIVWLPYWTDFRVFNSLVIQSKWAVTSIFAAVYYSLKPLFLAIFSDRAHLYLTSLVQGSLLCTVIFALWPLIRQGWRILLKKARWSTAEYVLAMFVFLVVYLLLWQKSFWPWYGTWFIPFGLLVYIVLNKLQVLKLSAWLSSVPIVHHIILLGDALRQNPNAGSDVWFYWVIVVSVIAYPLFILYRWRKVGYSLT